MELVNNVDPYTMGIMLPDELEDTLKYQPLIMWNIKIISCISAPSSVSSYRAYKCLVKIANSGDFLVNVNVNDFHGSFKKVHETIVRQTHGVLVLQKPINNSVWMEFVQRLLIDSQGEIFHQRPVANTGFNIQYIEERASKNGGKIRVGDIEVVYGETVYNTDGKVKDKPMSIVVPEAFPHKNLSITPHTPTGLLGYLKLFLPPALSPHIERRSQQQLALMNATVQHFYYFIVKNLGFCPAYMMASIQPEAMKSTVAMVGLKGMGDTKHFLELNSTSAAVDQMRDSTSLTTGILLLPFFPFLYFMFF